MCNLSQGVEEKGIEKANLISLKNLMKNLGVSIERAMAILEIPEVEQPKYLKLLSEH